MPEIARSDKFIWIITELGQAVVLERKEESYKDPLACEPANPYKRVEGYRVENPHNYDPDALIFDRREG